MKRLKLFIASFTLLVLLATTCSISAQESKNVPLTNFNEVSVSSGIDLYLTQSNAENIRVSANKDLLKNIVVEKNGSSLNIKYKNNINWSRLFKDQSIKVYVNYKTLQSITASGGSDVYTQNTLKTEKLNISASGGSDLKLDIVTGNLQIQASGGSDLNLKGSATNMILHASGGSDTHALDLKTDYAKVNTSGGSDANINVAKALDASASGGSDIHYKGNASVKKSSGKSGDINRID